MITIVKVDDKKQLKLFIDFPHELYRNDAFYVPELFIAQHDLLTTHPFLKHSEMALFLAYDDKKIAGRIAAVLNNNHNTFNQANDGFFGFFDTVNDIEVARLLVTAAEAWLKEKGVENIIGPVNPSTNETCGLLVDGFDSAPVAMMTYNSPYYPAILEQLGFRKKTDLLAYDFDIKDFNDKPVRLMKAITQRLEQKGIIIRNGNLKKFDKEVKALKKVYNKAWDKNMGFVPMTDDEFRYMAKDMKLVLDKDFLLVAEHKGKPVGFALCIPDINKIQIRIKKGRLLPTGILKLLSGRKKIKGIRIIALGVIESYRKMGIEAVFYGRIMQKALEKGIQHAEASWILEGNDMMNKAILHIKGTPYKRYRIYEKTLGQ